MKRPRRRRTTARARPTPCSLTPRTSRTPRVVTEAFEKVGENVDLVVVAVGLLGDQFAQENDAAAAASVALVNFAWPVAALAEVRRRLVAQGQRANPGDVLGRRRSASGATPISTAAPRPDSTGSVKVWPTPSTAPACDCSCFDRASCARA